MRIVLSPLLIPAFCMTESYFLCGCHKKNDDPASIGIAPTLLRRRVADEIFWIKMLSNGAVLGLRNLADRD
jgi:hypothetical protein